MVQATRETAGGVETDGLDRCTVAAEELARQIGDITSDTAFIVLLALSGLNIQY
jgi:hypothetical protein